MSKIIIRKMEEKDLPRVGEIFAYAREFMRQTGNPNQWGDYWPAESASIEDIENGTGYVMEDDGRVFATFAFIVGEDPTYLVIDKFDVYKKQECNFSEECINGQLYSLDQKDKQKNNFIEKCIGKKAESIRANATKANNDEKTCISKEKSAISLDYIRRLCPCEGKWLNDKPYGTIHRLAGDGTHNGIFEMCLEFCEKQVNNVRADTHEDNKILQHKFIKNGFLPCGVIYVRDHMPRLAFQKVVNQPADIEDESLEKKTLTANQMGEIGKEDAVYDFHGLKVQLEPKIVRVDNDEALDRLFTCFNPAEHKNDIANVKVKSTNAAERICFDFNAMEGTTDSAVNDTVRIADETSGRPSRKQLKKLQKEAAMNEAANIRQIYEKKYGKPIKITQKSLAVEIYGHYYILKKSDSFETKHGSNKLTRWIKRHMDVIDCGEKDVDNNRFVWDFLEKFW